MTLQGIEGSVTKPCRELEEPEPNMRASRCASQSPSNPLESMCGDSSLLLALSWAVLTVATGHGRGICCSICCSIQSNVCDQSPDMRNTDSEQTNDMRPSVLITTLRPAAQHDEVCPLPCRSVLEAANILRTGRVQAIYWERRRLYISRVRKLHKGCGCPHHPALLAQASCQVSITCV